MVFRTLSGFYQENPANGPRPTPPPPPPPHCFSTVGRDVVMVTILRDLLIKVAHTLEYPARVSKNAWVEAVVFS